MHEDAYHFVDIMIAVKIGGTTNINIKMMMVKSKMVSSMM